MVVASAKRMMKKTLPALAEPLVIKAAYHMATIPTAWGLCAITWRTIHDDKSLSTLSLPPNSLLTGIITPGLTHAQLRQRFSDSVEVMPDQSGHYHPSVVPIWFEELAAYLQDYYASDLTPADCPARPASLALWPIWRLRVDLSIVTAFQLRVLDAVAAIPRGQVLTYAQVAAKISAPQAARAVGAALGKNPWPVLIPCHRVIATSGRMTGFSAPGGVVAKQRMLHMEGWQKNKRYSPFLPGY